jgi:phosphoribosylformylglycinamidine cyclo-ligase
MASSGLHSNGYSLVRHVLFERAGWALERHVPEFGRTLGEELLEPTKIYSLDCLALARTHEVHAFAHITGGGLAGNLARVMPDELHARIDRTTWSPGAVFDLVGRAGDVARSELESTLNMGVGMVAVVPPESVAGVLATLEERGVGAWVAGEVAGRTEDGEAVTLSGDYAS